jgi:hypothetical protein
MASQTLDPELERRIAELENEANQGAGFTPIDWFWLIFLGAVGPALLLYWGWQS